MEDFAQYKAQARADLTRDSNLDKAADLGKRRRLTGSEPGTRSMAAIVNDGVGARFWLYWTVERKIKGRRLLLDPRTKGLEEKKKVVFAEARTRTLWHAKNRDSTR